MLARVFRGQFLALDAAIAEATGHEYAVHALEGLIKIGVRRGQIVGLDPLDMNAGAMIDAAVLERLDDGEIRVVQLNILAHQRDGYFALRLLEAIDQPRPVGQIGRTLFHMKRLAHLVGEALLFEHQRHLIQRFRVEILDDIARGHVAEAGQLFAHPLRDGKIAAADQHTGLDAHGLQRLDRVLRGLGFQLLAALEVGNQRNMNKQHVVAIIFPLELTNCLDEGLALDIADGTADLGDNDVAILSDAMELVLDFVGNVGNDLHRAAIISAAALAVQNGIEDLAGGHRAVARQIFVDEALIVAQIEVGFHAVLGDEHLTVLIGVHRAGIDVQVRIKLLQNDRIAARLEQSSERRRRDALAQRRRHAPGHKNVLGGHDEPSFYTPSLHEAHKKTRIIVLPQPFRVKRVL